MKKNIGQIDRAIRLVAGFLILGWGLYAQNWWGLVGIVPVATAFISFCPAYSLIKISTRQT